MHKYHRAKDQNSCPEMSGKPGRLDTGRLREKESMGELGTQRGTSGDHNISV